MKKKELNEWFKLYKENKKRGLVRNSDYHEFIRLNHLVLETTHKIHNDNMLDKNW